MIVLYNDTLIAEVSDVTIKTTRGLLGLHGEAFSTDFDIPRTEKLDAVLGLSAVTEREGQPFGDLITVQLLLAGRTIEGRLEVVGVEPDIVSLAVYEKRQIEDLLLRDLLWEDHDCLVSMDDATFDTSATWVNDIGWKKYLYHAGYSNLFNLRMPNPFILARRIADVLYNEKGVITTWTTENKETPIVPTSYYVDPRWRQQWFYGPSGAGAWWCGQHVCTDLNFDENADYVARSISFNRTATVDLHAYIGGDGTQTVQCEIMQWREGVVMAQLTVSGMATGGYEHDSIALEVVSGDELYVRTNGAQTDILLGLEFTSYQWNEGDYDSVEMTVYPQGIHPHVGPNKYRPTLSGYPASFNMYSIAGNFGDMTVAEFYDMMAAKFGTTLQFVGGSEMVFGTEDGVVEIEGEWIRSEFAPDELGQVTFIEWGDKFNRQRRYIPNRLLSDEVNAYSDCPCYIGREYVGSVGVMYVPQVDSNLKQVNVDRRLALGDATIREPGWITGTMPSGQLLPFNVAVKTEIRTFDKAVRTARDVYWNGGYWRVIEADEDEDSGEIKATLLKRTRRTI